MRFPNLLKGNQPLIEHLQGFIYVYFYAFVYIYAVTGVCKEKELLSAYYNNIKAVHKWGILRFLFFIFLYLVAII